MRFYIAAFVLRGTLARAALAASQYAENLPTIILNQRGPGDSPSEYVTTITEIWRTTLGAEIKVEFLDPRDFTTAAREQHGHIVVYGWCADYPDPQNFLDILFHTGSDFNVAGSSNAEVNALLEKGRSELDPARRLELYHQAETMILEDYATIPLQHGVFDVVVKPYVKGFVLAPMGAPIVHLLWLDYQEK